MSLVDGQGEQKKLLGLADVQALQPDFPVLSLIDEDQARRGQVVAWQREGMQLRLLTTNNFPAVVQTMVEQFGHEGLVCDLYYVDTASFGLAMSWYEQRKQQQADRVAAQRRSEQAAGQGALGLMQELYAQRQSMKAGDFVTDFVRLAYQAGASDLHLQAEQTWVSARVRVDGVLHEVVRFDLADYGQYLAKLCFWAGLKLNITTLPQDGRFSFVSKVSGSDEQIDVRVSSLPGLYQLSLVLRFLHGKGGTRSLADLGMSEYDRARVADVLAQQSGCVLVTGPTGSGKTTTLYAMLDILNTGANKIITLENPVEYQLSGVQQSQINEAKGYSYEKWLKAILRHDPDIILVGETRSSDTAQTMITASLTWHMVFTTLHTQRALESITRLLSMGVEAYLLAPSLKLICGQRLVRKLCTQCTNRYMGNGQSGMRAVTAAEKEEMQVLVDNIKKSRPDLAVELPTMLPCAVGCEHCQGTGYRGRMVIMETLLVTDEMRDLLLHGQDEQQLLALARKNGFLTMAEDGLLKVLAGETTWEEVKRVM